jgi:type IX secretion system substrate protein
MLGIFENVVSDLYVDVEDMNPYSKEKILKYVIPESDYVSINIYDINGTEAVKVLNEYMIRGSYTCTVDVSSLETGIYNCKIKSRENEYSTSIYILN